MATEHKICHVKDAVPIQSKDETGNGQPEATDEAMGDDAKDPGRFQQRGPSAAEPERAVAESMGE